MCRYAPATDLLPAGNAEKWPPPGYAGCSSHAVWQLLINESRPSRPGFWLGRPAAYVTCAASVAALGAVRLQAAVLTGQPAGRSGRVGGGAPAARPGVRLLGRGYGGRYDQSGTGRCHCLSGADPLPSPPPSVRPSRCPVSRRRAGRRSGTLKDGCGLVKRFTVPADPAQSPTNNAATSASVDAICLCYYTRLTL